MKGNTMSFKVIINTIISTAEHRETTNFVKEWKEVVEILENE